MAHTPNGFNLGDPNLFVKGMAEAIVTDVVTGDIIGYDNVATESSVSTEVNMGEITGGVGNPLLISIPDTTRISGTLTSQAFSLEQRALTVGGEISYGGVVQRCIPNVAPVSGSLYIPATADAPAKSYGQASSDGYGLCYVREHNATQYIGTNYGVSLTASADGYLVGAENTFTPDSTKTYDIMYFASLPSAQVLPLQTQFAPKVATISLKYCVYAQQNGGNANGTLKGYLYFVVPRAQFTGDAGVSASQTENATTSYSWTALMPDSNMIDCADCGTADTNYAYYVYIPCGSTTQNVQALLVVAGGISVAAGGAGVQIPVLYLMPNGQTVTPKYTDMTYTVSSGTGITVSAGGVVTGTTAGSGEITITLTADPTKVTTCNVTVTSA